MGFSVSKHRWSDLDATLVASIQQLAARWGSGRRRDEMADPAWWPETLRREPGPTQLSLSGIYASPTNYALEGLLDDHMGLRRWKAMNPHRRGVQGCYFVPFGFLLEDGDGNDIEPPFWTELQGASFASVIGSPVTLLDYYDGSFDDAAGRAYDERGKRACARLGNLEHGDETGDAFYGVEYAMEGLLREAWDERVVVGVYL